MSESTVRTLLLLTGLVLVGQALWMFFAPESFYDAAGPFGVYNDHYVRDAATFTFGLGAILVLAAPRPSWRIPALVVVAITFGVHAINHLVDIGDADPKWVGYFDFFLLAGTAILLAGFARRLSDERTRT
ncbi:MAG: DUF4345 family protein [Thermoleophilaceae bacterium]|nr:DUF4345 family protein [Thermoleophilaceae bacterium]